MCLVINKELTEKMLADKTKTFTFYKLFDKRFKANYLQSLYQGHKTTKYGLQVDQTELSIEENTIHGGVFHAFVSDSKFVNNSYYDCVLTKNKNNFM